MDEEGSHAVPRDLPLERPPRRSSPSPTPACRPRPMPSVRARAMSTAATAWPRARAGSDIARRGLSRQQRGLPLLPCHQRDLLTDVGNSNFGLGGHAGQHNLMVVRGLWSATNRGGRHADLPSPRGRHARARPIAAGCRLRTWLNRSPPQSINTRHAATARASALTAECIRCGARPRLNIPPRPEECQTHDLRWWSESRFCAVDDIGPGRRAPEASSHEGVTSASARRRERAGSAICRTNMMMPPPVTDSVPATEPGRRATRAMAPQRASRRVAQRSPFVIWRANRTACPLCRNARPENGHGVALGDRDAFSLEEPGRAQVNFDRRPRPSLSGAPHCRSGGLEKRRPLQPPQCL